MERMYATALQWIVRHGLEDTFRPRCEALLTATRGLGYWLGDTMEQIYARFMKAGRSRRG